MAEFSGYIIASCFAVARAHHLLTKGSQEMGPSHASWKERRVMGTDESYSPGPGLRALRAFLALKVLSVVRAAMTKTMHSFKGL